MFPELGQKLSYHFLRLQTTTDDLIFPIKTIYIVPTSMGLIQGNLMRKGISIDLHSNRIIRGLFSSE